VHRPPIRCFATRHVVQAVSVQVLAPGVKDVWHVVQQFDRRPTGCELPAAILAEKIGMSKRTVEDHIATLLGIGLLVRLPGNYLAATVPDDCVPSSARPPWREVHALARRLEAHLRPTRTTVTTVPPDTPAYGQDRIRTTVTTVPGLRSRPYPPGPTDYGHDRTSQLQNPAQVPTVRTVSYGVDGVDGEILHLRLDGEGARTAQDGEQQATQQGGLRPPGDAVSGGVGPLLPLLKEVLARAEPERLPDSPEEPPAPRDPTPEQLLVAEQRRSAWRAPR